MSKILRDNAMKFKNDKLINWELTPDSIEIEDEVLAESALALLLMNDVVFLNDHWYRNDFTEEVKRHFQVAVVLNDTFGYASADAERLPFDEIGNLYRLWRMDPYHGATAWAMTKRKERPITPVVKMMVDAGWDVEKLVAGDNPFECYNK